jgi:cytochrome c6
VDTPYCARLETIILAQRIVIMKHTCKVLAATVAFVAATALSHAASTSENWENLCTKCHGADGKGQTKVGKKLNLKDYTDAKVQAQLKDADMVKAIADGVTENGKERMKGFKADLSPAEINDLVAYVRKFKA